MKELQHCLCKHTFVSMIFRRSIVWSLPHGSVVELETTLGYWRLMEYKHCEFYISEAYHAAFCVSHSPLLNICDRSKEGPASKYIHIWWLGLSVI